MSSLTTSKNTRLAKTGFARLVVRRDRASRGLFAGQQVDAQGGQGGTHFAPIAQKTTMAAVLWLPG